ncbi:thaumatin family protein [Streptomyces phytohabitans]|uniref:thaumatin family protein n=1 Tax=Streptomyces phytohabitans TaxID=1150371 RepID=UPI00345C54E7
MRTTRAKTAVLAFVMGMLALFGATTAGAGAPQADDERRAADEYTVTLVNNTGGRLWIGSVAEPGSQELTGLPTLDDGQRATVPIPENAEGKWYGKFVPRQGCSGEDGGDFHCQVGDCGPYSDRCSIYTPQPASFAEFHFDRNDPLGLWYNTSYVDGVSVPVTVDSDVDPIPETGECSTAGCPEDLLPACPAADLVTDPATGDPLYCDNPEPDSPDTDYSRTMSERCPKAYSWSGNDSVPGNDVVRNCTKCSGFTVTFH